MCQLHFLEFISSKIPSFSKSLHIATYILVRKRSAFVNAFQKQFWHSYWRVPMLSADTLNHVNKLICNNPHKPVPRSIPDGVTGFFSDIPSDISMALRSTQPLVKMNTRNIPGGKGGRCVRLTTSPPSRAAYHEILEPKPPGTLWATPGLLRDCFNCYFS
jgi:hypothetical protein